MPNTELSSVPKDEFMGELKRRMDTGEIKEGEVTALIAESRPAVAETLAPAPATIDKGSAPSAGAEPAPDATHPASLPVAREIITSPEAIKAELERLSGGRFLSVEKMNEALKAMQGVNVEIPEDEIARLNALFPERLTPEAIARIEKLGNVTESGKAPLIMQIPRKVLVDGNETPFTIETLRGIMQKAKQANSVKKLLWLSDYVTDETKSKVWDSGLRAWTSACLDDSKANKYEKQLALQERLLGEGSEIHADMIIAICLRYISSDEELMRSDFMRLNDVDADGDPLCVNARDYGLSLSSSARAADSYSGLGASSGISS